MRPYDDGSTRHSEALSGYTKLTVERAVSRWILRMHSAHGCVPSVPIESCKRRNAPRSVGPGDGIGAPTPT